MLKATIIGRVGNDAKLIATDRASFLTFSVAHTERYRNVDGTKVEKTTWVECVKFLKPGQQDNLSKYVLKGTQIFVEGKPEADAYTDREGKLQSRLKLLVDAVELLGSAQKENTQPTNAQNTNTQTPTPQEWETPSSGNIPF
jgi:single-strand DNA-binding protein